jgi:2-methylcitrate dehydratase PrpD
MTLTDDVVELVESSTPTAAELAAAAEQLDGFRQASARGADGAVAAALTAIATDDPLWTAWISGAAAHSAGAGVTWVAVCAAADALAGDDERAAEAIAVGTAVADRVAGELGAGHTSAGWSVAATAGVIGAAAAVGRLLGLDGGQLRAAIGLCATQAAGFTVVAGTDADPLQVGKAAANAVEAGLLGHCGFTSSAHPLEGRRGLLAILGGRPD